MHYSKKLTAMFKKQVRDDFGEDISLEDADLELFRLARLVEAIYPDPPIINQRKE